MSKHEDVTRRKLYLDTTFPLVTLYPIGPGSEEYKPWDDVPMPRVPVDGELVEMVDDLGVWKCVGVTYRYVDGFASEPQTVVRIERVS